MCAHTLGPPPPVGAHWQTGQWETTTWEPRPWVLGSRAWCCSLGQGSRASLTGRRRPDQDHTWVTSFQWSPMAPKTSLVLAPVSCTGWTGAQRLEEQALGTALPSMGTSPGRRLSLRSYYVQKTLVFNCQKNLSGHIVLHKKRGEWLTTQLM